MLALLNTIEDNKQPAWIAKLDSKAQNEKYIGTYTQAERMFAEQLLEAVAEIYVDSNVYLNYRQKFVAVKVDSATLANKVAAYNLDLYCERYDIERVVTARGNIVYRATRDAMQII